jgi:hypothetical protein
MSTPFTIERPIPTKGKPYPGKHHLEYRTPMMPAMEDAQGELGFENTAERAAQWSPVQLKEYDLSKLEREWDWKLPLLLIVAAAGAGYGAVQAGVKLAGMWAP